MEARTQPSTRDVDGFRDALVVNNLLMEGSMWWTSHDVDGALSFCVVEDSP